MGCSYSKTDSKENQLSYCWKDDIKTKSITSFNFNEVEVDLTHFSADPKTLGLGGFGMVRKVTKLTGFDQGTQFAMKSMAKGAILKRSSGPSCVMTELKALVILSECNYICNIRYAFQDDAQLFMVLDLASGGDMRFNMRLSTNCRFSESVTKIFAAQIFLALNYCHKSSILHRDVKPENILMSENGYLKLSDFGVAKILPNIEDCRSTSGTHGYMAPEIYMFEHIHGTPAEWFATGITLHEFLTGRRPFEVQKLQAFRGLALPDEPLELDFLDMECDYLSKTCKDFIRQLLQPDCKIRLGTKNGLASIRRHSWFRGVDWHALETQTFPMAMKPDISRPRCEVNEDELKRLTAQLTSAPVLNEEEQKIFKDYEYRTAFMVNGDERIHHRVPPSRPPRPSSLNLVPLGHGQQQQDLSALRSDVLGSLSGCSSDAAIVSERPKKHKRLEDCDSHHYRRAKKASSSSEIEQIRSVVAPKTVHNVTNCSMQQVPTETAGNRALTSRPKRDDRRSHWVTSWIVGGDDHVVSDSVSVASSIDSNVECAPPVPIARVSSVGSRGREGCQSPQTALLSNIAPLASPINVITMSKQRLQLVSSPLQEVSVKKGVLHTRQRDPHRHASAGVKGMSGAVANMRSNKKADRTGGECWMDYVYKHGDEDNVVIDSTVHHFVGRQQQNVQQNAQQNVGDCEVIDFEDDPKREEMKWSVPY